MKCALCVNSIEEVAALVRNETETIDTCLVDRNICEDPNNKFLQIIPYVVFYTPYYADGKIVFIQYKRSTKNNEDRLVSKLSIGFGGHIDALEEIKYTHSYSNEDTTIHFVMSKQDLIDTCLTSAKRELREELGGDILTAIGTDLDFNESAFFLGDQREPVNQVHLALGIPVRLTEEQLNLFFEFVKNNHENIDKEIETIDKIAINIKHIVEEMDLTITNSKIMNQLVQEYNFENWSARMFDYVIRKEISFILKDINYDDLYNLAISKQQAREAEAADQQQISDSTPSDIENKVAEVVNESQQI